MQGCPRLTSQRGVFTAQVGNTALQWTRDERGLELVSQGLSDLTFIGEDKLQELLLAGEYEEPDVVDEVPIDCWLTLAGPSPIVIDDYQFWFYCCLTSHSRLFHSYGDVTKCR